MNLIGNAIKFTMQGHVLTTIDMIESRDGMAKIYVTIEDTGIGIPEHALPKLFARFSQADSSTTRQFGGTGLGLVRRSIEISLGKIACIFHLMFVIVF